MKDYGHVLRDEPEWADRAERFAAKVRDVTELLADHEPRAPRGPLPMRLAYHDACHLAHAQGVRSQPRALLRGIPELELVEPADWEICCGSAGVYNLLQARARRGARAAQGREPAGHRRRRRGGRQPRAARSRSPLTRAASGRALPVFHPLELLARSIEAAE